jgi:serine protease Do
MMMWRIAKRPLVLVWALFVASVSAQTAPTNADADPLHQLNNSVRSLVKRVSPSVVHLSVTGFAPVENNRGNTSVVLGRQQSVGSGVIIDPDGYIVTNAHMVRGSQRIQVTVPVATADESPVSSFGNSRERTLDARIVGVDTDLDLALLKIEAKNLPAVRLADYNKLRQGEVVFAFGSPEGLQNSVTMGVVSSVARQTDPDNPFVFIQTDAPINPGNSGGPLINVDGEMVGINTFILTEGGGNEGLGFAIPSAIVAFAYPQLRRYGHVHRGEAGLSVQTITPEMAAALKLPTDLGVIVSDVVPGSPAETAGLKVQDIVTGIDGQTVGNLPALVTHLYMRGEGEHIKLNVIRGTAKMSFDVAVVEQPHNFDKLADVVDPDKGLVAKLGIVGLEVDAKVTPMLPSLRVASGVIVIAKSAEPNVDSPLTAGDVIHAVNGTRVETMSALRTALEHLALNSPIVLQVERDGRLTYVSFELN